MSGHLIDGAGALRKRQGRIALKQFKEERKGGETTEYIGLITVSS